MVNTMYDRLIVNPICVALWSKRGKIAYALFLLILWALPKPTELSNEAWKLFLIFLGTIVGIMTQVYPMGAIALFAISACTITKSLTIQQTLSAFSAQIGWLIFTAFL